jgi:hypothetical protein
MRSTPGKHFEITVDLIGHGTGLIYRGKNLVSSHIWTATDHVNHLCLRMKGDGANARNLFQVFAQTVKYLLIVVHGVNWNGESVVHGFLLLAHLRPFENIGS